jgi:hypothetical protein
MLLKSTHVDPKHVHGMLQHAKPPKQSAAGRQAPHWSPGAGVPPAEPPLPAEFIPASPPVPEVPLSPPAPAVDAPALPAVAEPALPAVAEPALPAVAEPALPAVAEPALPAVPPLFESEPHPAREAAHARLNPSPQSITFDLLVVIFPSPDYAWFTRATELDDESVPPRSSCGFGR